MSSVQYTRRYTQEELVELWQQVQCVFENHPALIEIAVLSLELLNRIDVDDEATDPDLASPFEMTVDGNPEIVQRLIDALKPFAQAMTKLSIDGLIREEKVS